MTVRSTIAGAVGALLLFGAVQAQTPAIGDSPGAATVGHDATIARQRYLRWERGATTGYAGRRETIGRVMTDQMLPERFAPDAEEAAPAGR